MTIVCLGWGSLVRDPGELPMRGNWQTAGPSLPIEFARKPRDGSLLSPFFGRLCTLACKIVSSSFSGRNGEATRGVSVHFICFLTTCSRAGFKVTAEAGGALCHLSVPPLAEGKSDKAGSTNKPPGLRDPLYVPRRLTSQRPY